MRGVCMCVCVWVHVCVDVQRVEGAHRHGAVQDGCCTLLCLFVSSTWKTVVLGLAHYHCANIVALYREGGREGGGNGGGERCAKDI